jgi:signal peptidase I
MKVWRKRLLVILIVVLALAGLTGVYSTLFLWFVRVPTGSMKNTVQIGDRIVCSRVPGAIHRGDVIVLNHPRHPSVRYIERVIGMPGERIRIVADKVMINGQELPERREFVAVQGPEILGVSTDLRLTGVRARLLPSSRLSTIQRRLFAANRLVISLALLLLARVRRRQKYKLSKS